jgi:hypothetical protein
VFGAPTPILRSFDEQRTKRFYIDFLGFEIEFEHRFEPDMPLYLGLRKGECRLHLSEHYGDAAPGARIRIPVNDIHEYAKSLRDKQFENARPGPPKLMDWGDWELTVHDPSSNRLTFFKTEDR